MAFTPKEAYKRQYPNKLFYVGCSPHGSKWNAIVVDEDGNPFAPKEHYLIRTPEYDKEDSV